MEILKPNDILVATLNSPQATPYDMLSNNVTGENTSLFTKDEYKASEYIQKAFKGEDGKFDDMAFNAAYDKAQDNFYQLTNSEYLKGLDEIAYSPFDVTRPKLANTINVSATLEKEFNPFKERKGWTGVGSVDASPFSLRELAQQSKIFDPKTNSWSDESVNDLSVLGKLFGDTLVYAQFDTDGQHIDPQNGMMVNHKKGDWKINDDGNLFIEKLAGREVYGRQVVNSTDIMTTDGSMIDKFNFLDSDGREKAITGTVFKLAFEIAPFLIPGFGIFKDAMSIPSIYGGIKAAIGMATAMPTLYKSVEGLLLGETNTTLTQGATELEGWFSKFNASSVSDEGSKSLFGAEQMTSMVGDIFSQIYEQRAAASLSKLIYRADTAMTAKTQQMATKINQKLIQDALEGKIKLDDIDDLSKAAMDKIPELQSLIKSQSQMSKALSLGYMAITSTSEIYGQAIQGGYDRRTAGFAALAAAAGQYGIMMNNRMGDWFLDKTTGYNTHTNTALMSKSIVPWLDEIAEGFNKHGVSGVAGNKSLSSTFGKIKNSIHEIFTSPSVLGEAMWKNAVVEGVEEVTEQMVLDATKGVVDTMSYLGLTAKKGSLGGWETAFSKEGLETYLANFIGGVLGGGMFEFHRSKIAPMVDPSMMSAETQKSLYELVAGGHKEEVIKVINLRRSKLGNKYITALNADGTYSEAKDGTSQADLIADKAIDMVNVIDGILNSYDLIHTDEDIVNKAIMNKIIINDLKRAAPVGKLIGLEGLVLEDYKEKMSRIVKLETTIKGLGETDENKGAKAAYQQELNTYVNDINEILEGKQGSKYFRQALLYLNKDISSAFLKISRTDFAKEIYKVDYNDLEETGVGLTKERIDAEWGKYLESKDLRYNLQLADSVYTKLEQMLNQPIVEYSMTGYDQVRKLTLSTIMDLKSTIDLFNTADSQEKKQAAMNDFIKLNSSLESQGIVAPWTVLHEDMFDQLSSLGLIKKAAYELQADEKKANVQLSDFSNAELEEKLGDSGVARKDNIKNIISKFFRRFNMNPLNAEETINELNSQIDSANSGILKQIKALESLPDLTDEQLQKLDQLKGSLYDFRIDNILNTTLIKGIVTSAETEISALLEDLKINIDDYQKYLKLKEKTADSSKAEMYKVNFNSLLEQFGKTDWKELDVLELNALLDKLTELGFWSIAMVDMQVVSENSTPIIMEAITKLGSPDVTPADLVDIQITLEPVMNTAINLINAGFSLLNDENLKKVEKKIKVINETLEAEIHKVKPEILKLHNYALDLLLKAISSGNVDKEVFLEAEKLANEEIVKIITTVFPESKNLSYSQFNKLIEEIPAVIPMLEELVDLEENDQPGLYKSFDELSTIIVAEEAAYTAEPGRQGFFPSRDFLNFLKNSLNGKTPLYTLAGVLADALDAFNTQSQNVERVNTFIKIADKGIGLKSNSIYNFIRKFELSLDSNPASKVNKIFEILEREETILKSSSNITNYLSDNIREQDLNQALSHLAMMKAVVKAMATTEVSFGDPYGYIQSRQNYAKKYNQEDDVLNLQTITSDVASLIANDIDVLHTKISFLKELAGFNAGKMMNEQEIIRSRVDEILLANWKQWVTKMNPSFLPIDKLKVILASSDSNAKKLMDIEVTVFDFNSGKKEEALEEFLKHLEGVNPDDFSQIDKDVTNLEAWDLAVYSATVLASRASDFNIRSWNTIKSEFNKAPFYTQEFAARIVKASTAFPTVFAKIYTLKQNTTKTSSDFITIILGGAGTGKTSATLGLVIDNFRQTNENTNIWLSAPTELQVKNLVDAIDTSVGKEKLTTSSGTKSEIFEKLGLTKLVQDIQHEIENIKDDTIEKKYVHLSSGLLTFTDEILNNEWIETLVAENLNKLPNLLVIDEITHYSSFELHLLNSISKHSYNVDGLTFMKIVGAGDPTQLGYLAKVGENYYSYNVDSTNAIFTPRLWANVRASNSQKRLNNDRYIRVTRELEKIYKVNKKDYDKSKSESFTYLESTSKLNTLSYLHDSTRIVGDRIVTALDRQIVDILAAKLSEDPKVTLGVLTADGKLPAEWNQLFSDAGIITPSDMSRIKTFSPENVQGSEVDYFVFDANLITKFDKVRDNLKAFYTFLSRSKIASIIVDKDKVLEQFSISNGLADLNSTPFDPLTKEVINKAKEQRSEDLLKLLGEDPTTSAYDNFKWKSGTVVDEDPIKGSWYVSSEPGKIDIAPKSGSVEDKELEANGLKKGFKIMAHSFYNNPNVKVVDGKIIVNIKNPATDLNFPANLEGVKAEKAIKSWLKLKNTLLHSSTSYVISSDYEHFLKAAFPNLTSTENIKVEKVITVSRYSKETNDPYKKQGFKTESTLKDGDLFVNLSAKLTLGGETHYVTLASFATLEQIKLKATEYNVDIKAIENKFAQLQGLLDTSNKNLIALEFNDPNASTFLTSTRLLEIEKSDKKGIEKYDLTTLEETFPGLNFSNIKFFPTNFPAFKNLMSKYTFGEPRTEAQLRKMFDGRILDAENNVTKDKDGHDVIALTANKKPYTGVKGKPYVAVSYKDDLEGSLTGNTQAKLIPIGSNKRELNILIAEVNKIIDERQLDIDKNYDVKNPQNFVMSDEINAKTEVLLNRSDILDVLIDWGTKKDESGGTLLDLLSKEITFSLSDEATGNKTSVFNIFSRFKANKQTTTDDKLKDVLALVKDGIKKHTTKDKIDRDEIKKSVITSLTSKTGWHWTFFNIFAYDKIITDASFAELAKLMFQEQATPDTFEKFSSSKGVVDMNAIITKLMTAIKNRTFYYSIPIKAPLTTGDVVRANAFISGQNGFTDEFFGDKFFINVAPESARLLLDMQQFVDAKVVADVTPIVTPSISSSTTSKSKGKKLTKQDVFNKIKINRINFLVDGIEPLELTPEELKLIENSLEEELKVIEEATSEANIILSAKTVKNAIMDNEDVILEISNLFDEGNHSTVAKLLLEKVAPLLGDKFKPMMAELKTKTFMQEADKFKKEDLVKALGIIVVKGTVNARSVLDAFGLTRDDQELAKEIKNNIQALWDECK